MLLLLLKKIGQEMEKDLPFNETVRDKSSSGFTCTWGMSTSTQNTWHCLQARRKHLLPDLYSTYLRNYLDNLSDKHLTTVNEVKTLTEKKQSDTTITIISESNVEALLRRIASRFGHQWRILRNTKLKCQLRRLVANRVLFLICCMGL